MKNTPYLIIMFLFSLTITFGQTSETKLADNYFENLSYVNAIKEYQILANKNPTAYVLKRLGDSFYSSLRMKEAAVTYARLFTLYDVKDQEYVFKYSQSLKSIGKYADALYWMEKYQKEKKGSITNNTAKNLEIVSSKEPNTTTNYTKKENVVSKIDYNRKSKFTIENLYQINTPFSDFGTSQYQNTILFASPRKLKKISTEVDESRSANFLDIYQIDEDDIDFEDMKKPFSKSVNEKFHESSVSFSPDENIMYFTRNNYNYGDYKVDGRGYINLKIYKAEFINNRWKNIKELPFCSDNYSVGHPTVSADGKLLYFVSDMPGSKGATDIYVVDIKPNGRFSRPRNLGNTINTKGREMFPFIADDNTLYFSSDGHSGMGALDIFESEMINQEFQEPLNLEAPINSRSDDFAFYIKPNKNMGYLSSNRKDGKGDDDIYRFEREYENNPEPEECIQVVSGTVRNLKFQKYLPFAKLILKDDIGNVIKNTTADEYGRYSFNLPCNKNYIITGSKEYYKPATKTFITDKPLTVDLDLEIIDDFAYNKSKEVVIRIKTIYFDYDKWYIRPDAARELDHIVAIMNKYPKINVTSTSHTDSRGKALYNKSLSQKRADATVDYIIYQGISPSRISGKGYGETKLTNNCYDDDYHFNIRKCSENKHQANRRTSFVIENFDGTKIKSKDKDL